MDQHRAQTLQALEAFVHTQRQLLERQRADIDKLHRLRVDLCARPAQVLANLSNELDDPAFRLSEQADCRLKLPKDIHWSAFERSDTTPLQTFAHTQAQKQTQRTALPSQLPAHDSCGPNTTQHVQNDHLSELQKLVKTARRAIVDPVLDKFAGMSPEPRDLEEEEEERKERRRRERVREEIMKLRGCGLRVRLSSAMVLEREEEGMDVDVDVVDDGDDGGGGGGGAAAAPMPMEVDEGAPSAVAAPVSVAPKRVRRKGKRSPPSRAKHLALPAPPKTTRVCRPPAPRKSLHDDDDDDGGLMPPPPRIPHTRRKAAVSGETTPESTVEFGSASEQDQDQYHSDNDDDDDDDDEDDDDDSEESAAYQETRPKKSKFSKTRKSRNAKPKLPKPPKLKPETYKQAWSVSEQNLLEQLLEEIQDGERNRWQKISRAMGGRRTPRQVASRVQKYLEKLKKFGVDA